MGDQPIDLGGLPAEPAGPLPSLDLGPMPPAPDTSGGVSWIGSAADAVAKYGGDVVRLVNTLGVQVSAAARAGGVAAKNVQQAVDQARNDAVDPMLKKYGPPMMAAVVIGLVYVSLKRR